MGLVEDWGGNRRMGIRDSFGGEFEAFHCNEWGLRCCAGATRSSQITLRELVIMCSLFRIDCSQYNNSTYTASLVYTQIII